MRAIFTFQLERLPPTCATWDEWCVYSFALSCLSREIQGVFEGSTPVKKKEEEEPGKYSDNY